jgi:hypothetical protein
MMETPGESDQLPEEAPEEQVPDDTGGDTATGLPGEEETYTDVPDEEGTATGNPDAAGSEE